MIGAGPWSGALVVYRLERMGCPLPMQGIQRNPRGRFSFLVEMKRVKPVPRSAAMPARSLGVRGVDVFEVIRATVPPECRRRV